MTTTTATPKRILLSVSGMSPQVITETLYALVCQPQPWIPDEIHLITTVQGKEHAKLSLLEEKHFARLLQEYDITHSIRFTVDNIHIITDASGKPLVDLRTPEDNEAAADCIVSRIREITAQSESELHVSIAGGRKTMGFYAGYALSLFGRTQDRLSHVLVSEDFESNKDFFYPSKTPRVIYTRNDKPLDASAAKVWLAQIPFVRLRSFLPGKTLLNKVSFSEVVNIVDVLAGNPSVVVDISTLQLHIGSVAINLPPCELGLYLMFVRKLMSKEEAFVLRKNDPSQAMADAFLNVLESIKGHYGEMDQQEKALRNGMDREYLDPIKSRLYTSIEKALGQRGAEKYMIKSGARGSSELYLDIDPALVSVRE